MSNKRILSFIVCANGELQINVPKGHRLVVDQTEPTRVRIATTPSILPDAEVPRTDSFQFSASIGDVMEDGTIYAGISPTEQRPYFVPAANHMRAETLKVMLNSVDKSQYHDNVDWRLASAEEIAHLHTNRNIKELKGHFHAQRKFHWAMDRDNGDVISVNREGEQKVSVGRVLFYFPVRYHI